MRHPSSWRNKHHWNCNATISYMQPNLPEFYRVHFRRFIFVKSYISCLAYSHPLEIWQYSIPVYDFLSTRQICKKGWYHWCTHTLSYIYIFIYIYIYTYITITTLSNNNVCIPIKSGQMSDVLQHMFVWCMPCTDWPYLHLWPKLYTSANNPIAEALYLVCYMWHCRTCTRFSRFLLCYSHGKLTAIYLSGFLDWHYSYLHDSLSETKLNDILNDPHQPLWAYDITTLKPLKQPWTIYFSNLLNHSKLNAINFLNNLQQ